MARVMNTGKIGVSNKERTALINQLEELRAEMAIEREEHRLEKLRLITEVKDLREQLMRVLQAQDAPPPPMPMRLRRQSSPSERFLNGSDFSPSGLRFLFSFLSLSFCFSFPLHIPLTLFSSH